MDTISTLADIQVLKETSSLECKLAAGRDGKGALPDAFWDSYSAMANSDGGIILLGVREAMGNFSVNGIENIEKVRRDLFATVSNRQKVSLNLLANADVEEVEIGGKSILHVRVRRAKRQERPIYLNGNPLGNTFVRLHEGDQHLSDEAVKRMLAEQCEDSRDTRILTGFSMDDLSFESLRVYRQIFSNRQPSHPWNELENQPFLKNIGGWRMDRQTKKGGITAAGLLMFGYHTTIQEEFPYYMLDYQERPQAKTERRWIDRVTLDGTWSGNLYDFYRKVYAKLVADLKVPFELTGDQREDETPVHEAIREALCNVLVHADYSDRCSLLVVKRPDLFGFRNPGLMRIPLEYALDGGNPDCRNRSLHQMFRHVGVGDQSGSGIPVITNAWRNSHWRPPQWEESREPNDRTTLRMRMIDLFPNEIVADLRKRFGEGYDRLEHIQQVALVIAAVENTVTHRRLCTLGNCHAADATQCLQSLVTQSFLRQTGSSRGAVYNLVGDKIPGPEDVFDSPPLDITPLITGPNSPIIADSSPIIADSSPIIAGSSPIIADSSPIIDFPPGGRGDEGDRDEKGRKLSSDFELPFIGSLDTLTEEFREKLRLDAKNAREKRRMKPEEIRGIITSLAEGHYITISVLSDLLDRQPETLRNHLKEMVKSGVLKIAFPRTPNDPRQAYTRV